VVIQYRALGRLLAELIDRAWRGLSSMSRSRSYPILGVGLALAAPVGLVVARALAAGQAPTLAWTRADIAQLRVTYAYVASSTVIVLAVLGVLLGRSFDRVRNLSITDPLTGLFNRRYFGQRMAEELNRGKRQRRTTCILCVDIDRLKAINDGFGHKAGDRAIIAIGALLARNVRAADAVARIGGDEFAVLLPETAATQASALSQRLLKDVAHHVDPWTGRLAVSVSITEIPATAEVDVDAMLAAGDAALYRAKAQGGGRAALAADWHLPSIGAAHSDRAADGSSSHHRR
jgi:diguanylate cyclase (GGDEF)-like protein